MKRYGHAAALAIALGAALIGSSSFLDGDAKADPDPPPFLVSFAAATSEITVPGSTTVTATADRSVVNTGYRIHVVDDDGVVGESTCSNSKSCSQHVQAPWSVNANPQPRHFHAEIRRTSDGTVISQSDQVVVDVKPYDFDLTAAADAPSITVPGSTNVHANINRSVKGTGYRIHLVDDDGQVADSICSNSSTCSLFVNAPWSINGSPTARRFHAEVRHTTNGHLAAISDQVMVARRRFLFDVTLSFLTIPTGGGGVIHYAEATATPGVTGTGHRLVLRRIDGAEICAATVGTFCNGSATVGETYRAAVVAPGGRSVGESAAWTLGSSGAVEEVAEGIDLAHLADMLGSPSSICDRVLVSPYGSHLLGSSTSDQYLACSGAVVAAKSRVEILRAIAAAGSAGVGGAVLWWLLSDAQRVDPAPGAPTTETDASAPRPIPPPLLPAVDDLGATLAELNPGLAQDDADAIAHQCLFLLGRLGTNGLQRCSNEPIFASGSDVPDATNHDLEALASYPPWVELNYEHGSSKPGQGWQNCPGKAPDQQCDEYPFFATEQGGPLAVPSPHLKAIDSGDNQLQGSRYSSFITLCSLQTGVPDPAGLANSTGGSPFLGIPLPPDWGIPTQRLCN